MIFNQFRNHRKVTRVVYVITGGAVALHCDKAHVQSQWERANFDPNDIKIPEIFQI